MTNYDILTTLIISFIWLGLLVLGRYLYNMKIKRKLKLIKGSDFIIIFGLASLLYGGISTIYLAIEEKLLFGQQTIISQRLINGIAGGGFIWYSIYLYYQAIKGK